jgi:AcrR family transcriptional regulator
MEKNKKNQKKIISKHSILSVAKELISKNGYRGTSLEDISSIFNISSPALYYYFNSKAEILSQLHSKAFNRLTKNYNKVFHYKHSIEENFKGLIKNHAYVVAKNSKLVKIFFKEEREIPQDLKNNIKKKRKEYTNNLIELYKKGVIQGIFKDIDPKIAIFLILGCCNWICMWYSNENKYKPREIAEITAEFVCNGYKVKK